MENPSFELSALNTPLAEEIIVANQAPEIYGWTLDGVGTEYSNTEVRKKDSTSPSTSQFGTSDPSDGEYSLFYRQGWTKSTKITFTSNTLAQLPAGDYVLSVDYKQHYSYDEDKQKNSDTKVSIALNNGSAPVVTKTSEAAGGEKGATAGGAYFNTAEWSTLRAPFSLNSSLDAGSKVVITLNVAGARRSDFYIDNVRITYTLDNFRKNWQEAYDALKGLELTELPTAVKDAITKALGTSMPENPDDYIPATEALQELIRNYDGIKASYGKVKDLLSKAKDEVENSIGEKETVNAAIAEAEKDIETRTDASALDADWNTLEAARQAYVISGAEPTEGYSFDWTFKLTNPDAETGDGNGWTYSGNAGAKTSSEDPYEGNKSFNAWNGSANTMTISQKVKLPAGNYTLAGYLYSTSGRQPNLYATVDGETFNSEAATNEGVWEQKATEPFTIKADDTEVTVGVTAKGTASGWFRADNFQLLYNGMKPVLDDAIAEVEQMKEDKVNVGADAFQIPESALDILAKAVEQAKTDLGNCDTASDVKNAIAKLNEKVAEYGEVALNAPDAGTRYTLTLTNEKFTRKGYPAEFISDRTDQGNYNIKYNRGYNANLAIQHFYFEPVQGEDKVNQYYIWFVDNDKQPRYICGGSVYGVNDRSIRTTTEKGDALPIKAVISKQEGVIYLKNTKADLFIGSNGEEGMYTDENQKYYDFSIAEAKPAKVEGSLAAGKYATRIYPFAPKAIEGVKFFTSAGATNGILDLVEAEELEANVPYILYNETDGEIDIAAEGYGTLMDANTPNVTVGWLTGVYTEVVVPQGNYVLQTHDDVQAFYKVASKLTAVPYRAYLTVSTEEDETEAKAFYFGFGDDDATAIEAVPEVAEGAEKVFYNLAGQRIANPTKGIYIVNGKKVLVK